VVAAAFSLRKDHGWILVCSGITEVLEELLDFGWQRYLSHVKYFKQCPGE